MGKFAPSLLSADMTRLSQEVEDVKQGGASLIHLDIMDGHFVPNLSYGPHVAKCLNKLNLLPLDVHLMVERPENFVDSFIDAGADIITVHVETGDSAAIIRVLEQIRKLGAKPAVAIKPSTPLDLLTPFYPLIDMALVMSVEPGFGGQAFMAGSIERIRTARAHLDEVNPSCDLQVDGGITLENCAAAVLAGANVIVAGSSCFGADDRIKRTREFVKLIG